MYQSFFLSIPPSIYGGPEATGTRGGGARRADTSEAEGDSSGLLLVFCMKPRVSSRYLLFSLSESAGVTAAISISFTAWPKFHLSKNIHLMNDWLKLGEMS